MTEAGAIYKKLGCYWSDLSPENIDSYINRSENGNGRRVNIPFYVSIW